MTKIKESYSVLHIDPNELFREGLSRIFCDSSLVVVEDVPSFEEALNHLPELKPDLVIFDPNGYSEDALAELTSRIRETSPGSRIVILTDKVALTRLASALYAGIHGYLLKNMSTDSLKQSLRLVMMGETVYPSVLASLLVNNRFVASSNGSATSGHGGLSPRETEILSCLVNGLSNKEIAIQRDITEGTVKVHLKGILKKIRVNNRTQAAIWGVQNGMVADVFRHKRAIAVDT